MKFWEYLSLTIVGTAMLTFAGIAYLVFPGPRPLTLANPGLLVQLILVGGIGFVVLGVRGLMKQRALSA
jgi:hypothetical protein